jgi:hypothetical protein
MDMISSGTTFPRGERKDPRLWKTVVASEGLSLAAKSIEAATARATALGRVFARRGDESFLQRSGSWNASATPDIVFALFLLLLNLPFCTGGCVARHIISEQSLKFHVFAPAESPRLQ